METLYKYIKESLLDMEEPDEELIKSAAIKELVKKFARYKCKIRNGGRNSIGFIFNKKYTHEDWKKIVKDFESELNEMGFEYEKDSGDMISGSLKIYYDDFSLKVDGMEININMSYLYRLVIATNDNYMYRDSVLPEYGNVTFYAYGKNGLNYLKELKNELN